MAKITLTIISVVIGLFVSDAGAGLAVLEGEHTVVYDIVNPRGVAFIPAYSNESFEQKVTDLDEFSKRVEVTSKMAPMKTRVPFPLQKQGLPGSVLGYLQPERERQSQDPSVARLAREITGKYRYAHEAANAILSWIADNLSFDTGISVPSDALSALKYRKAYCVGYSNLAVALLRAAGIPARVAHGYLPPGYEWGFSKEYWGVKVNDGGYHAYLEIYYPDSGWTFSDAEHSHNFVDPFHILLRVDGIEMPGAYRGGFLDVEKATFYTVFREDNRTAMVDELESPRAKRLGRRLDERQHAALVTGRVTDTAGRPVAKGSVIVWKDGKGISSLFTGGRYTTTLTVPGKYRLALRGPGYAKSSQEIRARSGTVYKVDFTLEPGGAIRGRVSDAGGRPPSEGDVFYREGNASYGVSIDRDGYYVIEGLSPGTYEVSAIIGTKSVSRSVQVKAGEEVIADFIVR